MTTKTALIYLDHAAATPVDSRVLTSMRPYFAAEFYNPSATYDAARAVRQALEKARSQVAHWLGSRPSEIIFTAGGTEANNLAIHGVMRKFPKANIVISSIEHDSVLMPASLYECRKVRVHPDGRLDLDDLGAKLDDQTVLVSIVYASNEIGTIQPLHEVAKIIADKKAERSGKNTLPLYFHTDACQAANYLDLHVNRLGVDLLTLNGGKIYGPKQSAVLFVKAGVELQPLIDGGGQERNLRSGTENVPANIGLGMALDIAQSSRQVESARLLALQDQFIKLLEDKAPTAIINGSKKYRLPNNIHFSIPGQDNERLLIQLDMVGVQAAAGSACSARDTMPSHVLKAIGLSDEMARASLRLTMGRETTPAMLEKVASELRDLTA